MRKHQRFLEQIPEFISKAASSGKPIRKSCRNSYERKLVHEAAQREGLEHRTIVDNTQLYKNYSDVVVVSDSHCCPDCDRKELRLSWTPYSWVELNNGYEREEIGEKVPLTSKIENVYHLYLHKGQF
nr:mannosyltransferase OCH1-like protein [Marseillevirus cajuinensis]